MAEPIPIWLEAEARAAARLDVLLDEIERDWREVASVTLDAVACPPVLHFHFADDRYIEAAIGDGRAVMGWIRTLRERTGHCPAYYAVREAGP